MKKTQLILIVENNGMLENMLIKFVVKNFPKMAFIVARNAGEGLDMAIKYQPDVVIVNIDMMTQLAKELSQEFQRELPFTPCIFMSGICHEEIYHGKRELIFLEDSYHLEELKTELSKILEN